VDGDSVSEEPSEPSTLADLFDRLCPQYMTMGMSYDEYWNSNTSAHRAYREAYLLRREREEWARWRQGAYYFAALMCAVPVLRAFSKATEPGEYPKEPFPLTQKEVQKREERDRRINYEKMLEILNAESENELKERANKKEQEVSKNGDD